MARRIKLSKGHVALSLLLLLLGSYFIGPSADPPELDATLPEVERDLAALERSIADRESQVSSLKPDNQARIVWADDSLKARTEWAVVYVHGFTASQGEGDPVHREFARRYGCNLYLARLQAHGKATENDLLDFTGEGYFNSVKHAVAVGKRLGEKVLLLTTSTGGTAALYLLAQNPDAADGLVLYSPNIAINNGAAFLLDKPWGLQIGKAVIGGDFVNQLDDPESTPVVKQYWQRKYRLEAVVQLQAFMSATMTEQTFSQVKTPTFLAYYYRDEENQDQVVSVPAMLEMYEQLGTPAEQKRKQALPDANNHVIACKHRTKAYDEVSQATYAFVEEVLGMKPVQYNVEEAKTTEAPSNDNQ